MRITPLTPRLGAEIADIDLRRLDDAVLDEDIHAVHWLSYEAIRANSARMRSPLVLAAIEQHRRGICYPLELIYSE